MLLSKSFQRRQNFSDAMMLLHDCSSCYTADSTAAGAALLLMHCCYCSYWGWFTPPLESKISNTCKKPDVKSVVSTVDCQYSNPISLTNLTLQESGTLHQIFYDPGTFFSVTENKSRKRRMQIQSANQGYGFVHFLTVFWIWIRYLSSLNRALFWCTYNIQGIKGTLLSNDQGGRSLVVSIDRFCLCLQSHRFYWFLKARKSSLDFKKLFSAA